ncbi:beta-lactamase regulating signal transducer with metallopeptidase domain [Caulobacter ginsengisoli]|uniref:Beta-lactamase regulating signal transducer with metallopeptidase domain n=1 Tax=Caulobacter ginsengisoli TaxID=400775 RepID=A0ABU0ITH0_9CAUL|nr:M56 family metallopeptidase [Caulobacter ginsengisoli]MDQ0465308.1 beta-lactamase regulating signal transducer with metallopeptidase domain [Caulobacter ginsengisoli]
MTSDLLLWINLAVSAAVLTVLALRLPVRRLFGARIAYGLWALVPLAAAAVLVPARMVRVMQAPLSAAPATAWLESAEAASAPASGFDPVLLLTGFWLAGALASLAYLAWRQRQFGQAIRQGAAGPAVVGVLRPRVVTPADFATRYTAREQQVVLTHEAAHIARQDCRINALMALARCLSWFNPLVHLMGHYLRIDQELACDAQVVALHPNARRAYAQAMLKAQLAARPLPLGCYWPAPAAHPLAERVRLLARPTPGPGRRLMGAALVALVALAGAGAVWAARPAQVVMVPAEPAPMAQASTQAKSTPTAPARPAAPTPKLQAAAQPIAPEPAPTPTPPDQSPRAAPPQIIPAAVTMVERPMPERFDPNHRFGAAARRSAVAPGFAVRVLAEMTDPEGILLTTDMTAYGSQSRFRTGWYWNKGSRYSLFTSVVQRGDRFLVTASLNKRFEAEVSGSIWLADGQAGEITLPNGLKVRVRPTLRPETPDEIAAGRDIQRRT